MTKMALVKIGVRPEQAESMKKIRRIRQILEQHDAAVARLAAVMEERVREVVTHTAEESPAKATA